MEQREVAFRGHAHSLGYHPFDSVLLLHRILRHCSCRCRDFSVGIFERCAWPITLSDLLTGLIITDIERNLGVATPPMLREHPSSTLYDAAKLLIQTHARRLPLLDKDTDTGHEVIVSVLTQYRLLKFIAINVSQALLLGRSSVAHATQCPKEVPQLHLSLRKLNIGTYVSAPISQDASDIRSRFYPIATATLKTRVFDVVHMFSERAISAVPIIDEEGVVVNLYETVDVIVSPIPLTLRA
jgi:5'-AMP-activated protein kinase regulatory gamma subunit